MKNFVIIIDNDQKKCVYPSKWLSNDKKSILFPPNGLGEMKEAIINMINPEKLDRKAHLKSYQI